MTLGEEARQIVTEIERLEVKDGDLVLFRIPEERPHHLLQDTLIEIARWMRKTGRPNSRILLLGNGLTLETVSEGSMRVAGWVRTRGRSDG